MKWQRNNILVWGSPQHEELSYRVEIFRWLRTTALRHSQMWTWQSRVPLGEYELNLNMKQLTPRTVYMLLQSKGAGARTNQL